MAGAKVYRSVRRRVPLAIAIANVIGALTVFGLLAFFLPFDIHKPILVVRSGVLGLAYVGITLWVGVYFGRRRGRRQLQWLKAGRAPNERQRRFALAQPRENAFITACFWA